MPYKLSETDNGQWNVIGEDGKPKNKEPYDDKAKALAYLRALEIHLPANEKKSLPPEVVVRAVKDMTETGLSGEDYARQESWDIQQASSALQQIASLVPNEADEPQDTKLLANIMRSLLEFITGELAEMEKASRRGDNYEKSLNLSYAKSLGVIVPDLSVKYVALDQIKGYTFLWGNSNLTDVEHEYFTRQSNLWDSMIGKSARPLTWDHAQDDSLKAHPVIGTITDFGDDEVGRWYVAKLERSHRYRKAIDALIEQGKLGTSSDSAPQYVQRVKTGKATWLKEWPWFASALTDTPAEPRMIGSLEYLKSIGVVLPDTRETAWKYARMQSEFLKLKSLE